MTKLKNIEEIPKPVLDENEVEKLTTLTTQISTEAKALKFESDEDIKVATDFIRGLRTVEKEVANYFKEPKADAFKIHRSISGLEKEILEPLKETDKMIRKSMVDYENEKQRIIREQLRAEEKRREEEAERLLKEAEKHRADGDQFTGIVKEETAMELLETPEIKTEKVENLSVVKTWKARVTDRNKVPVSVNGMEIRPIDMKALNALARTSKGEMKIEGVEFYEETSTRIRS